MHAESEEVRAVVPCPACFARKGERCTQPTDNGRRKVDWVHIGREADYAESQETK